MARCLLAIALVGTSLFAFACGDDSSSQTSQEAQGTTGNAGVTPQVPPVPPVPGSSSKQGSGAGGSGSSSSEGSSRSDNPSSGKGGSGKRKRNRSGSSAPGSPGATTPNGFGAAPNVKTDEGAYRLANEICANVTLEGVALNFQISLKQRGAEFVAKVFSKGYPAAHRDAAYRGCLEGFRHPVGK